MKRVRFLVDVPGPNFYFAAGEEHDLEDAEANNWLQSGIHAELVEPAKSDPPKGRRK